MYFSHFLLVGIAAGLCNAGVIESRAACSSYTLIDTRGTSEPQGDSSGFKTMNKNILAKLPGGKIYDTVYPAGANQDSSAGTQDIINHIHQTLATNPKECFILEGYSQGAAATVNAMPQLSSQPASFAAVRGVFLIGDPEHRAGLLCNVDNYGGNSTLNVNGLEVSSTAGIPSDWVAKTLDVCIYADGVCDTTHGVGIDAQHLQYPSDAPTQNMGYKYVVTRLGGTP